MSDGDGEFKDYYGDGTLSEHCYFVNGNIHGEYVHYRGDGSLSEHCHYVHGVLHGEHRQYRKDGTLYGHYYYANDKVVVDLLKEPHDEVGMFELQLMYGGKLL